MKKVNKKLSLNKNVITRLNGVKGGVEGLPTGIVCGATIGASVGVGCATGYSCDCDTDTGYVCDSIKCYTASCKVTVCSA